MIAAKLPKGPGDLRIRCTWSLIHGPSFQDTQISSNDATIEIHLLTHFHFYTTIDLNLFKSGGGSVSSLAIKEESE